MISEPFLIPLSVLDTIKNNISTISSSLHDYSGTNSPNYLNNALNQIDSLLLHSKNLYYPKTVDEIEIIRESSISFRQSLSQYLRYANKEMEEHNELVKNLQSEVARLKKELELEKSRADDIILQFQKQFSESEARRLIEFNSFLNDKEKMIKSIRNSFDETISNIQNEHNEFESEQHNKARKFIQQLVDYQNDAKRILGVLSVDGHAAGYKKEADNSRKSRVVWERFTVSSFGVLIASAIYNTFNVSQPFTWSIFAAKWSITLAIGAAVTYFARQAAKHGREERSNRNMELQMATIDPYLDVFDETERREIKKLLVDRIFTGIPQLIENGEEPKKEINMSELTKLIETLLTAAKK